MGSFNADIKALRPLHTICNYLALMPNFNPNLDETSTSHVYAIAAILLNAGSWGFSTFGRITLLSGVINLSVRITESASDIAISSANILAILGMCFLDRKKLYQFLRDFKALDEVCQPFKAFIKCTHIRFIVELVLVHTYVIVYYVFASYTWITTVKFDTFKYFMSRDLQFYQLLMFTMLLRYYALSIKHRFEILNRILERFDRRKTFGERSCSGSKPIKWDGDLRWVKSTYIAINGLLDQYNEIFGRHFIAIYINILINILGPVNRVMVYGIGGWQLNGLQMGWSLIALCFVLTGLPLIMGSAIFSACQLAESEAGKIPKTCYQIVDALTDSSKDVMLRDELQKFAQEAVNRKPQFTAAGFFTVNYNIVFDLMGSISCYLIVLIQFNTT